MSSKKYILTDRPILHSTAGIFMDVPNTVTRDEMREIIYQLWNMVPQHTSYVSSDYIWTKDIPEPWHTRFRKAHRGSTYIIEGTAYVEDWGKFLHLIRPTDPYW